MEIIKREMREDVSRRKIIVIIITVQYSPEV